MTNLKRRSFLNTAALGLAASQMGYAGGALAAAHAFARLIWELASPRWKFDDATFARSAQSLDNPDHVAISISNYRWPSRSSRPN